jgi:hypothetical protein
MEKQCRKCLKLLPATTEFFYRNSGGKYGLTPRCKWCVNIDNMESHARRLAADPAKIRAQANERSKRSYQKHLEKNREYHRKRAAENLADPEVRKRIQARKRAGGAGLTLEEIQAIRDDQGNKCAICLAQNPNDLDHCHKTGAVRFLLCNHCNRGLGAFKDNPALMRKAADLLEQIHDYQSKLAAQSGTHPEHGAGQAEAPGILVGVD